jgi:hypothetical protein
VRRLLPKIKQIVSFRWLPFFHTAVAVRNFGSSSRARLPAARARVRQAPGQRCSRRGPSGGGGLRDQIPSHGGRLAFGSPLRLTKRGAVAVHQGRRSRRRRRPSRRRGGGVLGFRRRVGGRRVQSPSEPSELVPQHRVPHGGNPRTSGRNRTRRLLSRLRRRGSWWEPPPRSRWRWTGWCWPPPVGLYTLNAVDP